MLKIQSSSYVGPMLFCVVALLVLCTNASAVLPTHVRSFQAPGNALQMVYAEQYDLLFLRNSGSAVRIVDTNTQSQIGVFLASNAFSDMSLTPDGRYLFVADYGGERKGYGTPLSPHWVHRFDLQSQTWESQLAPEIAWQIEAVSSDRVLLLEHDQWVDMMVNSFSSQGMTELDRKGSGYYGYLEYSPKYSRAFHGSSGMLSSKWINASILLGDDLLFGEASENYGSTPGAGGNLVLSTDEERLYYGGVQVETLDVANLTNTYPETILAANAEIAFGANGYYSAIDATLLGELGYTAQCVALSQDGGVLWAFEAANDTLHEYVVPEPTSLALLIAGGASLLRSRKRTAA